MPGLLSFVSRLEGMAVLKDWSKIKECVVVYLSSGWSAEPFRWHPPLSRLCGKQIDGDLVWGTDESLV